MSALDDWFEDIIQEALPKAASVPCSKHEYRNQLSMWLSEIKVAIRASEER